MHRQDAIYLDQFCPKISNKNWRDSINKEVELICRANNTKFKISTDKLLETFISESKIMYNKKS